MIMQKIEGKNEEILQKKETHRHKLNEVHEAYKREIQKENERHLDDLKVGMPIILIPTRFTMSKQKLTICPGYRAGDQRAARAAG